MGGIAEVRTLHTQLDRCRTSAIATLTAALEQAREGKVIAVGVAIVRPDGAANSSFSDSDNGITLLGAITLLQKRMLTSLEDET